MKIIQLSRLVCFLATTFLFCKIALIASSSCIGQQDSDPFRSQNSGEESQWGDDRENGPGDSQWSSQNGTIDERDRITGRPECPVVVVGQRIFDARTLARTGSIDFDYRNYHLTAISQNGRYFAVATSSHNTPSAVKIFDTKTGQELCEIPERPEEILDILLITRDQYVITGGRSLNKLFVWNVTDGKLIKEFELEKRARLNTGHAAASQNGHYISFVGDHRLAVLQVATSQVVAEMQPPTLTPLYAESEDPNRTRNSTVDHHFIYTSLEALQFSPDGNELACLSNHLGHRLLVWNKKSQLEINLPFVAIGQAITANTQLNWFPDQDAWLANGNVIDRESGRIVLAFRSPFARETSIFVYDQNTILGRLDSDPLKLQRIEVPWPQMRRSLEAMKQKTPAWIAPYQSVGARLEFGATRGQAQAAKDLILQAIRRRLSRDGIPFEPDSPNYFRMRFSEAEGETLPIYERSSLLDRNGRDTGRKATLAKGSLIVELIVEGRSEPIWSDVLSAKSGTSFSKAINQQTLREDMLRRLRSELEMIEFPYFLPKDKSLTPLPLIVQ